MYTSPYSFIHRHINVHKSIHSLTQTCIIINVHTFTHIDMHTYVHTYFHTHVSTYTQINTHMYI